MALPFARRRPTPACPAPRTGGGRRYNALLAAALLHWTRERAHVVPSAVLDVAAGVRLDRGWTALAADDDAGRRRHLLLWGAGRGPAGVVVSDAQVDLLLRGADTLGDGGTVDVRSLALLDQLEPALRQAFSCLELFETVRRDLLGDPGPAGRAWRAAAAG